MALAAGRVAVRAHGISALATCPQHNARARVHPATAPACKVEGAKGAKTASRMRALSTVCKATETDTIEIRGLTPLEQICDEFVCRSSPAVEQSLRQLAKDFSTLREAKRSTSCFTPDVEFNDGARSFKGVDNYKYYTYIADFVENASAEVESMQMLELDQAEIKWRLKGRNVGGAVNVGVTATFEMNLITGRALKHTESWDTSACEGGAASFLTATRLATTLPANIADAASSAGKAASDAIGGAVDEASNEDVYVDPNDPMKFFQNQNTQQDDILQLALLASAVYLVIRLLQAVETLH